MSKTNVSIIIREAILAPYLTQEERIDYILYSLKKHKIKLKISELKPEDRVLLSGLLN